GLIPATIAPYLVRAIGARNTQRYALTAETFDAGEARALGLVHELAPATTLDARVGELAARLASHGPEAVRATKALLRSLDGSSPTQPQRTRAVHAIAGMRCSAEGREGVAAFLGGRAPAWR
ncbi:MAG: enoyl-CoA hydratase/isomerase family protein, partial [Pseudomonadota bacterium]|nr:enoyl-CoA hydratase/isomerase family protein [Pseudomonadota bacterium]